VAGLAPPLEDRPDVAHEVDVLRGGEARGDPERQDPERDCDGLRHHDPRGRWDGVGMLGGLVTS
jgi:hypothetical protein